MARSRDNPPILNKRRAARLAAVQALYQLDIGGGETATVVGEFEAHRLDRLLEPLDLPPLAIDRDWFRLLTSGAWDSRATLDPEIGAVLAEGWTLQRCDALLRAFLRAGAFELASRPDVPVKVAINEYVDLGHLFFDGPEPGFINGVLDRLATKLRGRETAS